jgi:hydrogenase/urease accessory protein HupE
MLHPFLVPAHVLLLLAAGLYMGQQAPRHTAESVVVFGISTLLGLGAAATGWVTGVDPIILLALAMGAAFLLVIDRPLPSSAAAALFGGVALLVGFDSAAEKATIATAIKMSLGTWLCACLVVFNVAYYTSRFTRTWQRVGVRVAGSWILAIAMLVIAFALRG